MTDEVEEIGGADRPAAFFDDLREITNAMPMLLAFFDSQHVCRFANDFYRRWSGHAQDQIVGRHLRDIVGADGYALRLPHLKRVADGQSTSFEATLLHRSGENRPVTLRYFPKAGRGGVDGFYAVVVDNSRQERRFRSVYDATAVAFCELDFSGVADMFRAFRLQGVKDLAAHIAAQPGFFRAAMEATRFVNANEKALEVFGITDPAAVLGGNVSRFWPRASEPVYAASVMAALGGRQRHFEAETVMARVDGTEFDALFTCTFPDPRVDGPSPHIVIGVVDITARTRAQAALGAAQAELAHAARIATLGELTASIAHEVNQPLGAVVTNGEAGLRWLRRAQPDLAETEASLERMIAGARRASDIIARIRAMATKQTSTRARFCPNRMVEEAVALVRREMAANGATVRLDLGRGLPEMLADRIQLQQVLINLLINAAQAMGSQGGAHGTAERVVTVRTTLANDSIGIEVADTGPGFGDTRPEHLFNAFFSTKPQGMGLGLSIARTIVEAHGGRITAAAGCPAGAVFQLTVPIDAALE